MGRGYGRNRNKKRDRGLGELQYDKQGKMVDDRDTEAGKKMGYKDIVRENKVRPLDNALWNNCF